MIALILTYLTLGANPTIQTSKVVIYADMRACEDQRQQSVLYQAGKHEADGMLVNGFCVEASVAAK